MKSFLIFEKEYNLPRTDVFVVKTKTSGEVIGKIKWYSSWQQYCFFPLIDTVWSSGCLNDIKKFIDNLMVEHGKK